MLKKTDPDIIKGYLEDSSNLKGGHADCLFLPENERDISSLLNEVNENKTPITVSAAKTGTTGGCIPFGGWILSTEKLNRIKEIDKKEQIAVLEPGVTWDELQNAVTKENLLYPPDPTEGTATIGGNVATNASGSRSFKFGPTRNWIRRLKIVLPNGETLNIKRGKIKAKGRLFKLPNIVIPGYKMPNVKNAAGYYAKPDMDLIDLFIGQEGTLGVVTEIEVALLPALSETLDCVAFFGSEESALDFVGEAKKVSNTLVIEYFDKNSLDLLKRSYNKIPASAGAAVYFEQEGSELEVWANLLEKQKVSLDDVWLGSDEKQKKELREFRHAMPEHINEEFKKYGEVKLATDIAVPSNRLREMINFYNSTIASKAPGLFYVKFGHIGENHLHVNLVPHDQKEEKLAHEIVLDFIRKGIALGGTISAEHGVGKIKTAYLKEMYGKKGVEEMKAVKRVFDANFILNRGNIFGD